MGFGGILYGQINEILKQWQLLLEYSGLIYHFNGMTCDLRKPLLARGFSHVGLHLHLEVGMPLDKVITPVLKTTLSITKARDCLVGIRLQRSLPTNNAVNRIVGHLGCITHGGWRFQKHMAGSLKT